MPMTAPGVLSASSAFSVNVLTYSAIAFQIYDWLLTLPFEVRCIWSKPSRSLVKWSYLSSRYIGILLPLVFAGFHALTQSTDSVPTLWCRMLHTFTGVLHGILLMCLSITLFTRLASLYDNHSVLAFILKVLTALEISMFIFWSPSVAARLDFQGPCLIRRPPLTTLYILGARTLLQGMLWTFALLNLSTPKFRLSPFALVDATFVVGAVFVALIGLVIAIYLSNFRRLDTSAVFLCALPMTWVAIGFANCHIIKNMEPDSSCPEGSADSLTNPAAVEMVYIPLASAI